MKFIKVDMSTKTARVEEVDLGDIMLPYVDKIFYPVISSRK